VPSESGARERSPGDVLVGIKPKFETIFEFRFSNFGSFRVALFS
jgi:hypothetical protein